MRQFHNFDEIEAYVLESGIKKVIALAGAHDSYALESLVHARRKGIAEGILIGHREEIRDLLQKLQEEESNYQIIDCQDNAEMTKIAVRLIHEGKADMPMKGLLHTSDFMRPVLNKETGLLPKGNILSQSTLIEDKEHNRFFQITDCAINIAPDVEQKKKIIRNAAQFSRLLGVEMAKVAVVSALEVVNPKIPSTVDAEALVRACREGELPGCIVEGPLGFDNAVSKEAAEHKGIESQVAGQADVLVVPELCCGNMLTKCFIFFTQMRSCGVLLGTEVPVIAVSRTDTPENKYRGILVSMLMAEKAGACHE